MEWSEYSKTIRIRLGLTQLEFAKLLGVTPFAIQGWEYGKSEPSMFHKELLLKIDERIDYLEILAKSEYINKILMEERRKRKLKYFLKELTIGTGVLYGFYKFLDLLFREENNENENNDK